MTNLSLLLPAIDLGDEQAASQLLSLVYEELRKLTAQKLDLRLGLAASRDGRRPSKRENRKGP